MRDSVLVLRYSYTNLLLLSASLNATRRRANHSRRDELIDSPHDVLEWTWLERGGSNLLSKLSEGG